VTREPYDYRNCQSLFGYAQKIHQRSNYTCELCGCGGGPPNFDLWHQFTVEHLVGQSQGGYLRELRGAVAARFPDLAPDGQTNLVAQIDAANTVTACSFCNSTTSRDRQARDMAALLAVPGSPDEVLAAIRCELSEILDRKQQDVRWKLASVRAAFDRMMA
jgi:hypothetical protein